MKKLYDVLLSVSTEYVARLYAEDENDAQIEAANIVKDWYWNDYALEVVNTITESVMEVPNDNDTIR